MGVLGDDLTSARTLRYLSVIVMLGGMSILMYLEATTEDGTIGILVIALGIVLASVAEGKRRRRKE